MSKIMQNLIEQYVEAVKKIYGSHVRQIILYGSYAFLFLTEKRQ